VQGIGPITAAVRSYHENGREPVALGDRKRIGYDATSAHSGEAKTRPRLELAEMVRTSLFATATTYLAAVPASPARTNV
jgi:hypothetical protein